jgi:hypothetical protein
MVGYGGSPLGGGGARPRGSARSASATSAGSARGSDRSGRHQPGTRSCALTRPTAPAACCGARRRSAVTRCDQGCLVRGGSPPYHVPVTRDEAQRAGPPRAERVGAAVRVGESASMPSSTTTSRRRCGQPLSLSTGVVHRGGPRRGRRPARAHRPRPARVDDLTRGRALTPVGPPRHTSRRSNTLVASPRRVALHAHQRDGPGSGCDLRADKHARGRAVGGHCSGSSTVDISVGSMSPDLSPRTWLPQPLQTRDPAPGAGQPAQYRPVGMTHRLCKARLPNCLSIDQARRLPPARAGPDRLAHPASGPMALH